MEKVSKKPIGPEKVEEGKEYERENLCFLYNNVERNLSLALQPGTHHENIVRLVQAARDNLRTAMRHMGWKGEF